jgi:hypothetical protein
MIVGWRKFGLAILALFAATFLQATGKLDPGGSAYVAIVLGTVGAYIYGNVKSKTPAP